MGSHRVSISFTHPSFHAPLCPRHCTRTWGSDWAHHQLALLWPILDMAFSQVEASVLQCSCTSWERKGLGPSPPHGGSVRLPEGLARGWSQNSEMGWWDVLSEGAQKRKCHRALLENICPNHLCICSAWHFPGEWAELQTAEARGSTGVGKEQEWRGHATVEKHMGYQKSQMDIPQAGLRQDRGRNAFCLLHSPISVNDCGWEAFRTVALCQGFLPDFWNTSLSWLPSSLPGCSFSAYPLSSSPSRCYVSKCL